MPGNNAVEGSEALMQLLYELLRGEPLVAAAGAFVPRKQYCLPKLRDSQR